MAFMDYWSPGIGFSKAFMPKKPKEQPIEWIVDPWTRKMRDVIQPKLKESFYDIPQGQIEGLTEKSLAGRLGRGVEDIRPRFGPEAAAPYYQAGKARMGERHGEEMGKLKDILAKEQVLTSTPGIQEKMNLVQSQGLELEEFSQRLMYEDIARDIEATKMAENIIAQTLGQGIGFGAQQFGQAQWPFQMAQQAFGQAKGDLGGFGYKPAPKAQPGPLGDLFGGMDIAELLPIILKLVAAA